MRILITGGNGFIGSHLIEKLQSKIGELDSENEDQYNELLKHQQVLDKIAPGREGGTPQGQPGTPSSTTVHHFPHVCAQSVG